MHVFTKNRATCKNQMLTNREADKWTMGQLQNGMGGGVTIRTDCDHPEQGRQLRRVLRKEGRT